MGVGPLVGAQARRICTNGERSMQALQSSTCKIQGTAITQEFQSDDQRRNMMRISANQ